MDGHGDLVTWLIMGLAEVVIWLIGVTNLFTKSPGRSKYGKEAKKANCGARPVTSIKKCSSYPPQANLDPPFKATWGTVKIIVPFWVP